MATVYTDLIPREVANEAIAAAKQESVCLTLGNVIRMSEGLESVPVVSVAPVVDFVTPTYGGRKPMTTGRAPRRAEPDHARVVVVPGVGVIRNASRRCSVETPLLH